MITWIQSVTQKHHKTVFGILLVAIIVAFVFTVGSVPFLGDRNRGSYERSEQNFFGYDLSSNSPQANHFRTCVYFQMLTDGVRADTDEQWSVLVMRQAYLSSEARGLGMQSVSQAELDAYVKSRPAFLTKNGDFDSGLWKAFVERCTKEMRLSVESLNSILSNNALIEKTAGLVSGPGYISEKEAENMYCSYFGDWNLEIATLSASGVKVSAKPTQADLEAFYKQNGESYRVPEAYIFDAVFESADSYKSQVAAPSDADLSAYYAVNSANYSETVDGKLTTPPLSKVADKVRADYISSLATSMAVSKLEDVSMKIFESKVKKDSTEFKKILTDAKIALRRLDPVRADKRESLSQLPAKALEAAIILDDAHFYSDTVATPGGAWLVFFVKKEASFIPPFADVKARVEADWLADATMKAFTEKGATLVAAAKKVSDGAKGFDSVMKEAGAKVEKLSNISLVRPSPDMQKAGIAAQLLYSVLPSMKDGEVSQMFVLGDDGFIVRLDKYTAPKFDANSGEYKSFVANVRRNLALVSGMDVVRAAIAKVEKAQAKSQAK